MLFSRFVNTEGSLITNLSNHKNFYILKKDPFNNFLWKSLKKGSSSLEKNKKLFDFKSRILDQKSKQVF